MARNVNLNRRAESSAKSLPRNFSIEGDAPRRLPRDEIELPQKFFRARIAGVRLHDRVIGNLRGLIGEHLDIAQLHVHAQGAAVFRGNGPRFFGGEFWEIFGRAEGGGIFDEDTRNGGAPVMRRPAARPEAALPPQRVFANRS